KKLHVGDGVFHPVSEAIWKFEISGLEVVQSWLAYRMQDRSGKKSSDLDDVKPNSWPAEFTTELLELLHTLEETLNLYEKQATLLDSIISGPLLMEDGLVPPPESYRGPLPMNEKQRSFW